MSESIYWIPRRTIGATEKDKWLECSNCGHMINMYDLEHLRFEYVNISEVYNNAIKTQYRVCEKCGSKMDTALTFELRQRRIAKGDYRKEDLEKIIEEIKNTREYKALSK